MSQLQPSKVPTKRDDGAPIPLLEILPVVRDPSARSNKNCHHGQQEHSPTCPILDSEQNRVLFHFFANRFSVSIMLIQLLPYEFIRN